MERVHIEIGCQSLEVEEKKRREEKSPHQLINAMCPIGDYTLFYLLSSALSFCTYIDKKYSMSQESSSHQGVQQESPLQQDLLFAFRTHYHRFEQAVPEALAESSDSNVLARLGDDLDTFSSLVAEVCMQSVILHAIFLYVFLAHRNF